MRLLFYRIRAKRSSRNRLPRARRHPPAGVNGRPRGASSEQPVPCRRHRRHLVFDRADAQGTYSATRHRTFNNHIMAASNNKL